MNKEEPYRDQAERLRRKIEKVKDGIEVVENKPPSRLPSRVDAHRDKKNKTKWKVKFPIIRLLALFFILLPIVIISAYSALGSKNVNTSEYVDSEVNGFEEINLNDGDEETVEQDTNSRNQDTSDMISEDDQSENTSEQSETIDVIEDSDEKNEQVDNITTDTTTENKQKETNNQKEESDQEVVYHKVQPNETLFRIAMNYYQSQSGIKIIQDANQLNGNEIKVGQILKIPK